MENIKTFKKFFESKVELKSHIIDENDAKKLYQIE